MRRYFRLFSPADDAGALAAINAAIEQAGAPASTTTTTETSDANAGGEQGGEAGAADPEGGGGAGGGDPGAGAGEGGADEPTAEELAAAEAAAAEANTKAGDGAAAGDPPVGHERDPKTGRFVKKAAPDPDAAAAKGAKPQAEIDPKTGKPKAKAADHVNDPIPDEIKGRTRERIEGLAKIAKDLTAERDGMKAELEDAREFLAAVNATGASTETFAAHLNVLALMHSPKLEDKQAVLGYLRKAVEKIGAELGETPADKDPLEGHQDLLDDVDAGELKRDRAIEIAKARNRDKAATALTAQNRDRENAQTAAEQKKAEVKAALNGLTTELRKRDGDAIYNRKHAILVPFIRRLNPAMSADKMAQAVREAYDALELAPVAQPNANGTRAPAGTGNNQPQRHKQGASGQVKVPTSPMEALEFGLEEHARATGAR